MYRKKSIGVVIPAYNEEHLIGDLLKRIPKYVDKIVVIDDTSKDKTSNVVKSFQKKDKRLILIIHKVNQGVGGAIASGYVWCRDNKIDVAAVMSGDGQIITTELPNFLKPVINGKADYAKANRLITKLAKKKIPRNRFFGNSVLSFLTKLASGYWYVMDSQAGYTAINKKMLHTIDWSKMYKRYGQPNDLLVRLNVYNAKVIDIPSEPVYRDIDVSDIRIRKVIFTISFMLLKMFFWRLKEKYLLRDFHPLILFYFFGLISSLMAFIFLIRVCYVWLLMNEVPSISFLSFILFSIFSVQFLSFAMLFDMEYNKDLKVN